MLSLGQIQNVCSLGSGSLQCRYLTEDEIVDGKFYCLKLVKQLKKEIDQEVDDFIKRHKDKGMDPYQMGLPVGKNCDGYLFLKYKVQGYDI